MIFEIGAPAASAAVMKPALSECPPTEATIVEAAVSLSRPHPQDRNNAVHTETEPRRINDRGVLHVYRDRPDGKYAAGQFECQCDSTANSIMPVLRINALTRRKGWYGSGSQNDPGHARCPGLVLFSARRDGSRGCVKEGRPGRSVLDENEDKDEKVPLCLCRNNRCTCYGSQLHQGSSVRWLQTSSPVPVRLNLSNLGRLQQGQRSPGWSRS